LESLRPTSAGEEELQLQLALAMSKEEHDEEQRRKKGDEAKLQMALDESRRQSATAAVSLSPVHGAQVIVAVFRVSRCHALFYGCYSLAIVAMSTRTHFCKDGAGVVYLSTHLLAVA